ncbi:MAG: glucose-6-phosphate dehydrogenase assembly protein OpcA [Verrucomicrobia bacterium]|nr:glucose-6-phosphate dehydrogenase assembly protein OpcA [Verrucomicrobiota bacterium]
MPTTDTDVTAQFLSGIPVPVEPAAIERELAALWKPASEQAAEGSGSAVTRVCLANLVVVARARDAAWIGGALDALSARYPCRMIWLQLDDASDDAGFHAEVTALCHLPSPGNPQVCSELITLHTGRGGVAGVPGAVLPLLEIDVPVALWWAMPADSEVALFDAMAALADRIVVHPEPLTSATLRTLSSLPCLRLCERPSATGKATVLVWHAMGHWRELTAEFFDHPQLRESLDKITIVNIRYATPTGAPTATLPTALFVGWLAGQLAWTPRERIATDAGLRATFDAGGGRTVTVEMTAQASDKVAPGRLLAVDVIAAGASFHLERVVGERQEIRQTLCVTEACTLLKTLPITERHEAVLLGVALESQSAARVFPRAARIALWLQGGR